MAHPGDDSPGAVVTGGSRGIGAEVEQEGLYQLGLRNLQGRVP